MTGRHWLLAAPVALVMAAAPASALADDAANEAIRSTIEGQLQAFLRDDAAAAYGFAAPGIQRMFPSSDQFMQMVRNGYAPVYRPQSYRFESAREVNGSLVQEVRIVDANGVGWLAVYTMQRQEDGSWKISGCSLVKAPDQSV